MTQKWNSVTLKIELESTAKVDGVAIVNCAQVMVEAECARPTGSLHICFPQPKIEDVDIAQEPNAESGNVLVDAAVMKARRLAAPKEVSRWTNRRMYRPGTREKNGIDRDSGNLSPYHRSKLRYLLSLLFHQRKWHHASGVLGVLLGISYGRLKSTALVRRWSDFAAAMEVLRRVDHVESNDLRVRRMFRVLSLQQPNARSRVKVQLELALYLISGGHREAAFDELCPIVDGKHRRDDPLANLCHGLNSYRLWYKKCIEEDSKQVITELGSRLENEGLLAIDGTGENNAPGDQDIYPERPRTPLRSLVDTSRLRYSRGSRAAVHHDSDQIQFEDSSATRTKLDINNWQASQRSIYEETDEQGFVQAGEEFWHTVAVPWSPGLDRQLFPIQVQREIDQKHYIVPMNDGRARDLHAAAVKHLKQTLSSAPEMMPALLPLVQLLLAVHDIKGAVDEIDKCSYLLKKHFIPPSMKAALLESLDKKDPIQLAACHRDVLIRNPLSFSSLNGLANLHTSGNLETELLLKYICLHLDVDPGAVGTWKKLSCCFLEVEEKLQQLTGGGVDINLENKSIEVHMEEELRHPVLTRDDLRQFWWSRYRWWSKRHFYTEVAGGEHRLNGDRWLLAHKAACAAHIYGSRSYFVEHACKTLEKQNNHRELRLVKHHCERALELFGG